MARTTSATSDSSSPASRAVDAQRGTSFATAPSRRLDSIDVLRGLVMVVMALDHVRDFFSDAHGFDPTDLTRTTPALFSTRFVTHFCAPVFVFLAGTGAFLAGNRGKSKRELALFLLTRGAWLVLLELTVVHVSWSFTLDWQWVPVQVIWAIGWSMIVLAGLVLLPTWIVALIGVVMIVAHNAFDGVTSLGTPFLDHLWTILHVSDEFEWRPDRHIFVLYPLVPWIGVMAAGYGFGSLMIGTREQRRRRLFALGLACCAAFVVLRSINAYGEPQPWSRQDSALFTVFSFVRCTKYPPSLDYLLMTLGPAIVLLAWLPEVAGRFTRPLAVFGRVPLFYYLLHLPLIHLLAVLFAWSRYGGIALDITALEVPAGYGYGLPVVYGVWIGVVSLLYLPCRWFADLKRRRRDPWLSYL